MPAAALGRKSPGPHRDLPDHAKEAFRQRLVETKVRFKRLSDEDIEAYLASGEWRGKAGGYAAQGIAGGFMVKIVGSYSNIVGCRSMRPRRSWRARAIRSGRLAQRGVIAAAPSIWRVMIESAPGPKMSNLPQADGRGLSAVLLQALR